MVRVGSVEIGGDGWLCLRFSLGQFACMTHVQFVEKWPRGWTSLFVRLSMGAVCSIVESCEG